jgi:hypothetical protein
VPTQPIRLLATNRLRKQIPINVALTFAGAHRDTRASKVGQ